MPDNLPPNFNAGPAAAGYLYQCRYALLAALQLGDVSGVEISIEQLDDVAFERDGSRWLSYRPNIIYAGRVTSGTRVLIYGKLFGSGPNGSARIRKLRSAPDSIWCLLPSLRPDQPPHFCVNRNVTPTNVWRRSATWPRAPEIMRIKQHTEPSWRWASLNRRPF